MVNGSQVREVGPATWRNFVLRQVSGLRWSLAKASAHVELSKTARDDLEKALQQVEAEVRLLAELDRQGKLSL